MTEISGEIRSKIERLVAFKEKVHGSSTKDVLEIEELALDVLRQSYQEDIYYKCTNEACSCLLAIAKLERPPSSSRLANLNILKRFLVPYVVRALPDIGLWHSDPLTYLRELSKIYIDRGSWERGFVYVVRPVNDRLNDKYNWIRNDIGKPDTLLLLCACIKNLIVYHSFKPIEVFKYIFDLESEGELAIIPYVISAISHREKYDTRGKPYWNEVLKGFLNYCSKHKPTEFLRVHHYMACKNFVRCNKLKCSPWYPNMIPIDFEVALKDVLDESETISYAAFYYGSYVSCRAEVEPTDERLIEQVTEKIFFERFYHPMDVLHWCDKYQKNISRFSIQRVADRLIDCVRRYVSKMEKASEEEEEFTNLMRFSSIILKDQVNLTSDIARPFYEVLDLLLENGELSRLNNNAKSALNGYVLELFSVAPHKRAWSMYDYFYNNLNTTMRFREIYTHTSEDVEALKLMFKIDNDYDPSKYTAVTRLIADTLVNRQLDPQIRDHLGKLMNEFYEIRYPD